MGQSAGPGGAPPPSVAEPDVGSVAPADGVPGCGLGPLVPGGLALGPPPELPVQALSMVSRAAAAAVATVARAARRMGPSLRRTVRVAL
jgi:hypothetical protein